MPLCLSLSSLSRLRSLILLFSWKCHCLRGDKHWLAVPSRSNPASSFVSTTTFKSELCCPQLSRWPGILSLSLFLSPPVCWCYLYSNRITSTKCYLSTTLPLSAIFDARQCSSPSLYKGVHLVHCYAGLPSVLLLPWTCLTFLLSELETPEKLSIDLVRWILHVRQLARNGHKWKTKSLARKAKSSALKYLNLYWTQELLILEFSLSWMKNTLFSASLLSWGLQQTARHIRLGTDNYCFDFNIGLDLIFSLLTSW